jgi:hypothetical protein
MEAQVSFVPLNPGMSGAPGGGGQGGSTSGAAPQASGGGDEGKHNRLRTLDRLLPYPGDFFEIKDLEARAPIVHLRVLFFILWALITALFAWLISAEYSQPVVGGTRPISPFVSQPWGTGYTHSCRGREKQRGVSCVAPWEVSIAFADQPLLVLGYQVVVDIFPEYQDPPFNCSMLSRYSATQALDMSDINTRMTFVNVLTREASCRAVFEAQDPCRHLLDASFGTAVPNGALSYSSSLGFDDQGRLYGITGDSEISRHTFDTGLLPAASLPAARREALVFPGTGRYVAMSPSGRYLYLVALGGAFNDYGTQDGIVFLYDTHGAGDPTAIRPASTDTLLVGTAGDGVIIVETRYQSVYTFSPSQPQPQPSLIARDDAYLCAGYAAYDPGTGMLYTASRPPSAANGGARVWEVSKEVGVTYGYPMLLRGPSNTAVVTVDETCFAYAVTNGINLGEPPVCSKLGSPLEAPFLMDSLTGAAYNIVSESRQRSSLTAYSPDGNLTWSRGTFVTMLAPSTAKDGTVFAADSGSVTAYDRNGTQVWSVMPATTGILSLDVMDDRWSVAVRGDVSLGVDDRLELVQRQLTQSPWSLCRDTLASSGMAPWSWS